MKKSISSIVAVVVSHLTVILGLDLLVLLVIDVFFNHAMNFLGSNFFRYGCMLFALCGIYLAVYTIADRNRKNRG